ncbi:amino acid adenylation domain-containing protein [Pseudomonas sp. B21-015]|uniref:amino acid adenylation domain-containing protein n=1 Tax=Pseudomonas sp. B21-015 TaxID=2895473 RepID=UPI0021604271|nr:amino acid adenylation domain-containing protein [Pseudomonas sp. B21-015]UVM52811.1 amino acid adenylation domain-containing protein [Pseudomonas sp. B21-015]
MSDNHSTNDGAQSTTPAAQLGDRLQERAIIAGWNDTHHEYPLDQCLQQLIEQQVERSPDAVAVRFGDQSLSFCQLNRRANRLARYLRELGIGPDSLVGVQMERSLELMIALLAILKAGGAYLPLDPGYPEERLALIIDDASVTVVLTQQRFELRLKAHDVAVLCLDDPANKVLHENDANPASINRPDDLAYVIYTSGSTGRPKGCMLPHKAICNRLLWMQRHYAVGPADRILQKTPYTFDVSVWELFLPLLSGACLVMARPEGHKDAHYLVDIIKAQRITICHFVPSMLRFFLKHPAVGECRSLSKVFVSGEALTHDLLLQCRALLSAQLHNLYGPTEAAVDVTWWLAEPREDQRVPIGRPIDNIQIHILDAGSNPVPIGQTGELCIGGVGLARGYLNRPELTAEKFVHDPFSTEPHARLYRTGDEARFLDNGEIEVLGRFDSQVKLRGFRIELGEIENTLKSHPLISDAVVLVKDPGSEDPKLVAYVVAEGLDKKAIRDFVKSRLPEYMTPNLVHFVEQIPVTPHGKADRQALLAGDGLSPGSSQAPAVDPQALTAWLQHYFIEALGINELAVDDDLFDQGATSFTLVQAVHSIHQQYQVTLPVEMFLEQPTIAAVTAFILEAKGVTPEQAPLVEAAPPPQPTAHELIRLETVRFDSRAYQRTDDASPASLERLGCLLSLLREVTLEGEGKYLYSSAGGLNAIQCYVYVAEGRIGGLPGGAWYYQPRLNRLLPVSVPAILDPQALRAEQRAQLAEAGFALFLVAETAAITPLYNHAAPSLLVLEAGYIEQLLLSRQADFDIALTPAYGVDVAAVVALFKLQPSHRLLHCLIEGDSPAVLTGQPGHLFAEFLAENNNGFDLPGKEALEQLHRQQRQIRHDLPEQGDSVIELPTAPVSADALRLRAAKRQYGGEPLSVAQLSRLLSLLKAGQGSGYLYNADAALDLKIYLHLAGPTTGHGEAQCPPPGIYRYHRDSHSLSRIGEGDPLAFNGSYTPFNRKHAQQARLRIFIIAGRSPAYGGESRYFNLLQAGRIGQLLLEKQAEFGIGLCPIGSMYFDRIRGAFDLDEGDELLHSFVGGTVTQLLPVGWPRLELHSGSRSASVYANDGALAIIGISGRYPGAANPQELWQNLSTGRSAINTVSRESLLYGDDVSADSPQWAVGALAGKQLFDPLLFKITPAEAKTLDPQERLFLQTVWHCLENSGYTAAGLRRMAERVGVFVGAMWGDYQHHQPGEQGERTTSFLSAIANRVSFFNDFNGPSVAFDTSCSSAMTALHFACSSIRQGECQAAIVGGVNLISHPSHLELLTSLALLSGDGQSHPFGLNANGWVAGEGVGALLIRPLEDARRDGDQILGVIRTTAISHSGKTFRYGTPSADSQAASMRRVLQQAGLPAEAIGYVEAAAPGASLADGAEFAAINKVFGSRLGDLPLKVGSIKANIGHLESASALSQITKVLMQFKHRQIAPTLGCNPLSPLVGLENSNLAIADTLSEWQGPQRALINAFGASGSGGHLILDAPPPQAATTQAVGPWLFPFTAASRAQLEQVVTAFADDLQAGRLGDASLGDISYTLCVGRVPLGHRLVLVADTEAELLTLLKAEHSQSALRGTLAREAQPAALELDLRGLDRHALNAIASRWVVGESDLAEIARHDSRRVALAPYPFAAVDCHIVACAGDESAQPPARDDTLQTALEGYLKQHFSRVSAIPENSIDSLESFDRYGLTSLMITSLNQRLAEAFGELSSTLFFEHQSISALATWFAAEHPSRSRQILGIQAPAKQSAQSARAAQRPETNRRQGRDEPIAIIGLAGRFPGAPDVDSFWDNLKNAVDSISEIPAERWQHHHYYSRDRSLKGKINTKWGGFIDGVDRFDPLFFNISPRDAERMDPQERIFLETAWHTLEDAGYDRAALQRHYQGRMGVFVGVMHGEYLLYTRSAAADCADDAVDSSFGSIANRVSYVFDCNGPSMAIDTICSSSLTALHLAVESLKRGECQVALAGGVNLSLHPNKYFIQSQLTMSSTDGRCRSFGEGGDGFVPGEGAGAVLLKPLARAQADGDNIYGVIRATSVNHNGKTHGYTVPSPNAQGAMIAESLEKAGMNPRELSYIEAHGTGTALGDPIEISGLQQGFARRSAVLGSEPALAQQCALGSAKSNIGHLESAAGIAGIAKVLLQLKHRQLAPSLHSSRLNPGISFADSPFYIPQQLQAWRRPLLNLDGREREYPLVASVSSFGSGGSNGHVIIAQYVAPVRDEPVAGQPAIIVLSARTPAQLQQQVERLQQFLQRCDTEGELPRLADLAFTLQRGREALEYRLAFSVAAISELQERLAQGLAQLIKAPEHFGCFDGLHIGRVQDNKAAIAVLAHDEDMAATLAAWADKGKYQKLLELWVKGLTFDWALFGAATTGAARRISLPGYPFARERIWVSGDFHFPPQAEQVGEARLHPLLHRNVSDLSQQKFTSVFSGNEFFLRDHRVRNQKVLPGVAYLEMAREAISRSLGELPSSGAVSLCNLVWSQPLMLGEQGDEPATVDIHINSVEPHRLTFEIREHQQQTLCCQGEAVLLQNSLEPAASLASLQAAIKGHRLDADALYRLFDSIDIHYGPSHRPVRELHIDDGQLLARIELPPSLSAGHRQFVLHPSLMDGALQSTVGLLVADQLGQGAAPQLRQTRVPFALARLQQSGGALGEQIWAWVRPGAENTEAGQSSFDIDIYNQQGEHCVALQGFVLREMKASSPLEMMLDDRPQTDCYLVEKWRRVSPQPLPPSSARLLLIANDPQGQQQLTARYPHAVSLLLDGSESIEKLTGLLGEAGPVEHLLWLAPTEKAMGESADGMINAQQTGVQSCFRLIKALLVLALDQQPLKWTVITRATLTVFGEASPLHQATTEPVAPAHASLHGLIGVMAKEYSHWLVRLVDLPAGDSWPSLDLLSLPADPRGDTLACRNDVWYRQYLAPCLPPAEVAAESLYRDGGVYLVVGGAGGIGRLWSEHLIRTRGAQVIWLGRREQDSRIDAAISELAQLGPAPHYISADAGNHAALQQAVKQVLAGHGRIHGVIHAAIQLEDQSLARMDAQKFAAGLAAKVDVCVRLAEVFEHQPLDFMLFFSSLQSFTKSAGQSNYAAGCTFKNAFGHYLAQHRGYPVKVINWGYWGDVGSVASDDYRRRMADVGLGSIEGEQAMLALETLLGARDEGAPLSQLTFLRTSQRLSDTFNHLALARHPAGPFGEYGEIHPPAYPSLITRMQKNLRVDNQQVRSATAQVQTHKAALDELQVRLLYAQLQQLGYLRRERESVTEMMQRSGLLPMYQRWLDKSLEELAQRGYVQLEGDICRVTHPQPLAVEALWHEWEAQQPAWLEQPSLKAEALLAEATLRVLPQILDGRIVATDILFPDASMSMVEGIYKDNPVSDFFNEVLLDAMLEFVRGRLEQSPQTPLRILEIGAGTGGTSARAFEKLRPYQAQIAEYCYSDVSQVFLMHARQVYGPQTPYLSYQLLDVDKPLAAQGIMPGAYDLVIATNVLHATQDLHRALKNAKAALKHNGLVLINEIARNGLFTHLTFGLLKGWWLFDDPELRMPGGPALAPKQWKQVLESEGYRQVYFPALADHDLGQQIVIAQSNGMVWQDRSDKVEPARTAPVNWAKVAAQAPRTPQSGVIAAPMAEVSSTQLKAETVRYLKQVIGGLFKIVPEQIDAREALETYGIDSILVVQLTNLLRDKLAGISSTLFFEYQTVEALADHFVVTQKDRLKTLLGLDQTTATVAPSAVESVEPLITPGKSRFIAKATDNTPAMARGSDVAIVGLAGRYANSDNVRELWQHLKNAENCIDEVPADRWDWHQYFDQAPGTAGRIYTPWGGFIREIDKFDPLFFHLSPREALKMDPQERLFLEEAYHCISDAGYTPGRLAERHRVGVFVGVMNGTYARQSTYWSVANRVSYQFNFQGPSLAVDTACSSSITAIHLALESLHSGVSDCVLVGGVNLVVDPVHYRGLTEMKMLSAGRQCKAFGAEADGFVAGEGVGALLLKPLAQAEADGDRIYGVIKASMINAGGKTNGYTVPNPLAQSRLVVDSLARAGIDARAVSYVEAHGTGTALGDPIEIAGLTRAFKTSVQTPVRQYCAIGSVKSNIGHCESAAGIAGITKVLLQLQHRQLVPSLHADALNPEIDFVNSPFAVQQSLAEWSRPQVLIDGMLQTFKRIATVSSFGAGGANAHVVIEEYEDHRVRPQIAVNEQQPAIIPLSARTREQLVQQARLLLDELAQDALGDADLPALAFTLQVAREAMEHRHGLLVSSLTQLKTRLRDFIDNGGAQARGRLKPDAQASSADIVGWIERGEQQKLLDAWLSGVPLDWRLMYPQGAPAPLSLPGYPFARERYWRDPQQSVVSAIAKEERLHPLLHRNVSDLRGLRYLTRFTGGESVLVEHQVNGKGVLPGAAMIAMIQAALTDALGGAVPAGRSLVIRNLAWLQSFSIDAANKGELFLELSVQAEGEYQIGICSYDRAGQLQLHCRALAATAVVQAAQLDFNSLGAQVIDVEACYQCFAVMGIDYGIGHRRLLSLLRQDDKALARVALQNPALNAGFALHPALLDAAMQGVMALLFDELGERPALLLPDGLGECVLFSDCPAILQVQIRSAGTTPGGYRFDLALFDENGQCCATLNQLSFKTVSGQGLGASSGLLCHKNWRDAEQTGTSVAQGITQVVLTHAFYDLMEPLQARGISCFALPEGDYQHAALALAEQLKSLLRTGQPCLTQLLVPINDPHGYCGLGGLLCSVSREQPALISQLIEVAPGLDTQQLLTQLSAEAADPGERQLRYLADAGTLRRQQLSWRHQPLDHAPAPWRPEGVYLITGGLGGVGTVMARAIIAAAPQARVVLCGRTPTDAPSVVDKLAQLGTGVDYRAVDLADADQVQCLIADVVNHHGALHGIIHCAGITRDALLTDKPREDFAAVFAAKVDGVHHLDRFSAGSALDFFVLYSSIASVLGNAGQTDYAAANGYLDAFASLRNQQVATGTRHGRTLAINWPLWLEGGLHMSDTARRVLAQRTGIEAMASATGIQAFCQALHSNEDQLMVLAGDTDKLVALLSHESTPAVEAAPIDGENLLAWLRQLLANTVKIGPSRLDNDVPFEQYGIDSLMIMEMTAALEKRFGALSKTLFFEYPSLQGLADHLATRQARKPPQEPLIIQLRTLLASTLNTPPEQIDDQQCFEDHGIDSLQILDLTRRLEQRFGALSPALLFEHSSLRALADYLASRNTTAVTEPVAATRDQQRRLFDSPAYHLPPTPQQRDDVAIIGIAGRYPDADDLEAFWQNLSQGKNSIGEIPPERWDWRDYYSTNRRVSGVHNSKWGGFIDGIDQFDPLFFNISPLEAELIDPQERLFLQTAWAAMEDAGYSRQLGDNGQQVGVYAGVMYSEYQLLGAEASLRGERMGFAGSSASIANRVSFCLNLQGPSLSLDSMCSSSLTALHLACQDLRSGRTTMAIAGGVNLTLHPNKYLMLSSGQFISSQGQCASFGEGGDGYVPGEGVGVVILKRLADAERDGDQIYGLIKGSYLNHGGKNTGYSVPDPRAQQAAISGALKDAQVDPAAISYIEAHGTGTRLGDPIEIAGLANALGKRTPAQTCWIGSVKSNIGHCEAAAGIAGLTKVLLQLKHGQIVPSLHSRTLNPFIDFAATPFEVNQHLRDWPQPSHDGQPMPRIAGISSFGAGGSNAHLIVAQYLQANRVSVADGKPEMIMLSAREPEQLRQTASRLLARLEQAPATHRLAAIAYTLQVGREAMEHRAAFITASMASLRDALRGLAGGDSRGWICGDTNASSDHVEQFKNRFPSQWREQLARLFANGEQQQLLELWSAGLRIDWTALWAASGERRQRISLPTYPFATSRYWAPTGARCLTSAPMGLHPLLHRNSSTFDHQQFTSVFSGDEPWLRDHVVNGRKTLPGAACLELIRAAVTHSLVGGEAQAMVIEQLNWLASLTVESAPRRLRVNLERVNGQLAVTVLGEDGDQPHCQARVITDVQPVAERLDLAHWRDRTWQRRLDDREVYRLFDQMGLAYGASHRGIRQLLIAEQGGQREVLAQLNLEGSFPDGEWWLEPGMTDSALQAAIGMLLPLDDSGAAPLSLVMPFALQRLEIIAPCQREMWAVLRSDLADNPAGRINIDLCDDQGRICARFVGLSSRQLTAAAKKPVTKQIQQLMTPIWSVVDGTVSERQHIHGARLIFGATPARRQALAELYPQAAWVDDSPPDYEAELHARPGLAEVMWLAPPDDGSTDLIAAQQHGIVALFRLIKALLSQGYGPRPLRLTLVTNQAIGIRPGESCRSAHAAVHGLAGSLAKEYPHWIVQLADLPDERLALLDAVPFAGVASGELLALRQGQWWFRQLAQVKADTTPTRLPVYRDGGVYLVIGGAGGIGAVWSRHMISQHRARVIWIGRRALDAQLEAKLDDLTAVSLMHDAPAPVYLQVDAADEQQLAMAKQQITERFGPINGVVHSAIVLKDQSLANMDEQTFTSVLNAKVATSVALARTFGDSAAALDFVLFFSSMMSFSTSAGQSNYAAGCTFADAFADQLRGQWSCPIKVINWGYWGSVGTVSDARYRERMTALGLGSIEPEEGLRALEQLLAGELHQLALLKLLQSDEIDGHHSLAGLLGHEHIALSAHTSGAMAAMQDRLGERLAALAAIM